MLNYVLSRGCRFLDFEIYWGTPSLSNGVKDVGQTTKGPIVSISNDPSAPGANSLSLFNVLNYIKQNAFSNNICPNSKDPLFVQLRIKYVKYENEPDTLQGHIYDTVSEIINDRFSNVQWKGKITSSSDISTIGSNIVVILDTFGNRDYKSISTTLPLSINMESNSNDLSHTTYEDKIKEKANQNTIDNKGIVTNMTSVNQVLPMSTVNSVQYLFVDNYDSMSVISNYGANITPMMFWKNDSFLEIYENMFVKNGGGILKLSSAMKYADAQKIIPRIAYP
jgi:hypothetical protein